MSIKKSRKFMFHVDFFKTLEWMNKILNLEYDKLKPHGIKKKVAEAIGVNESMVGRYYTRGFHADFIMDFAMKHGLSVDELLGIKGSETRQEGLAEPFKPGPVVNLMRRSDDKNYVTIRMVDEMDHVIVDPFLKILALREWIRQQVLGPAEETFMTVMGDDSMRPTYHSGDILVIDRVSPVEGGAAGDRAYLIKLPWLGIRARTLQFLPNKTIKVTADSGKFDPIIVNPAKDEIEILGRIVWYARRM